MPGRPIRACEPPFAGNWNGAIRVVAHRLALQMPGSTIPRDLEGRTALEDLEETLEDEELEEELEDSDESEPATPATPAPPGRGDAEVESIQEILVKQEARDGEDETPDEEETVLTLSREERLEPLPEKVVPPQPTEFICQNCYLVKHRSQLKDKAKMLCRDCA